MPGSIELSYQQYRSELRIFFARRARRTANVEDLVQEVYERLLRYRSLEPIRDPEAYLFQTARNVLRAANRNTRIEEQRFVTTEPADLEGYAGGLASLWIQEDGGHELVEEEIERVLNQLPRGCRVALVRQRRDGWTHQQIADELGVSINTVKDYLGKAFNHFRIHFSLHPTER
jgi:RNA polymerase sigma-19 factor, ECF subfamily